MEITTSALKSNHILKGKAYTYRIEKVLGQGSFGITYLASTSITVPGPLGNIVTEIKVAVKEFYMKEFSSRKEDGTVTEMTEGSLVKNYSRKFRKEAENLAKLSHPNIVNVLEVFDANNTCYYSMQYIPGGSLDSYVKQKGGLPESEAIECILQIGAAVQYMHDHKMLHLDLKPSNVMRSEDGSKMVLIDFGLSKQYTSDGAPEANTAIGLGTPGYAPSEQCEQQNDENSFRATIDVYALGGTLFKMLTGQTPPKASEITSSFFDGKDIIKERLFSCGISVKVAEICSKAMFPSSKKRFQSVSEMLQAIGSRVEMDEIEETEMDSVNTKHGINESSEETMLSSESHSIHNGHEYVDLGLSVKWATCNIGADSPEKYGEYFAWGETETKKNFDFLNYKFYYTYVERKILSKHVRSGYSKYNANDGKKILDAPDDVAHVKWGGKWRMPTKSEFEELQANCTSIWTDNYKGTGVKGRIFTSKKSGYTDKSIFLPAAGYGDSSSLNSAGYYGYYWSSTFSGGSLDNYAWTLLFYSGNVYTYYYGRCNGRSVRPVSE